MKPFTGIFLSFILLGGLEILQGQTVAGNGQTTATQNLPASTPYAVTTRDADSSVWERTTYENAPDGTVVARKHDYTQLETGLNYTNAQGQWTESKEEIDVLPQGGAEAVQGQHQAYFPADIYQGVIKEVTPDGVQLQSRPLGLGFFDGTNTVLIAELTNSTGVQTSPNQVIYPNAFVGVDADLQYTYTKAGLEQDVILRAQPPAPEAFGLVSRNSRLQVLTEFFNPPQPKVTAGLAGSLPDETLDFGVTKMVPGKAFLMGTNSPAVPVGKQWVQVEGRQFLVEEIPIAGIAAELDSLPMPTALNSSQTHLPMASRQLLLPPQHLAKDVRARPMQLAGAALPAHGLVMDYVTLNHSTNYFTFQADTTYYISGNVSLSWTNTIEGGAVIKFTNGLALGIDADNVRLLTFATAPDRMAVLTSKDDDSVGEQINGSTGSPTNTGSFYLILPTSPGAVAPLANVRIAYAGTGVWQQSGGMNYTNIAAVENCQFASCAIAINDAPYDDYNTLNQQLFNVLFSHCGAAVTNSEAVQYGDSYGGGMSISCQNVTADTVTNLLGTGTNDYTAADSTLTNCILTAVTHQIYLQQSYGSENFTLTNDCYITNGNAGVYASGPLGNYYLPTNSPLIDAGSESAAAAGLGTFTTQSNQVYDTGTVDLGYHYPVDGSADNDFWLAFFNLPDDSYYDNPCLSLYISSAAAASGTVSVPGFVTNGPALTVSGCGDANVNGTYLLTTTSELEQSNAVDNGFADFAYVKGNYQVVADRAYYWKIIQYDGTDGSYTDLYGEQWGDDLNANDWSSDSDTYSPPTSVSCPSAPFSVSFALTPGVVTRVDIPLEAMLTDYDVVETNGIHVIANAPVSVYGMDDCTAVSTAFTGYPTAMLGTNYCLLSRASLIPPGSYGTLNSQFMIVGTASNTTVTITPSATASLAGHSGTYTETLDQGQTYQIESSDETGDITGTVVTSDKPVGVFAGDNGAVVPSLSYVAWNPLMQEQLPVNDWGTNVVAMSFAGRLNGDLYRVLAYTNATVKITNGATVITASLAPGVPFETNLDGAVQFVATQPIQVAQFANGHDFDSPSGVIYGDPCEILLSPAGHWLSSCAVYAPSTDYIFDPQAGGPIRCFDTNYVTIIVASSGISTTLVDGSLISSTSFTAIGTSGYYEAQIPLEPGSHTISNSQPIEVQVYGWGAYDAYGYFGGIVNFP